MKLTLLRKIDPPTNQAFYTCAKENQVNDLLRQEWHLVTTNQNWGTEAECWQSLANLKSGNKRINLAKPNLIAKFN